MNPTVLTPEAKDALRTMVRVLHFNLVSGLSDAATSEYQLTLRTQPPRLSEARRVRRERLEAWIGEQIRGARIGKGNEEALWDRFFNQAVEEAAHTLLNHLVFIRILEHHGLISPHVITGGLRSPGYANEFLQYAGPLANDESKGYRALLGVLFDELAIELPGLFGPVGLTALFPIPAGVLNDCVEALNRPELATAWGDDTTLGWVYQYWNDPHRELLDKKIAGGGKIEPHEIASKTQMFTERYMVEWLLQNSLGFTWLCICKKNGWTADAEDLLPALEARRVAWRQKRDAGDVPLDALMPILPGGEEDWKYYVPQPIPEDAVEKAPASLADLKLLDPACGSGHFLVIAFGLLARMHEEEARHRGVTVTPEEVAERIVAQNLHGIDIDPRAIQIAAAALWLRAKLHAPKARLTRMNLVAPSFHLAALPEDDGDRLALGAKLYELGIPFETTERLIDCLKGVDHLGTLLRVDREIAALLDETERDEGPLFAHGARKQRARLEEHVATFLDAHAAESDLGLRLEGEQLAAGVRFIELAKEGRYDVVVGNPPYQGTSKMVDAKYVTKTYPTAKADLYAAFIERSLQLTRAGGIVALATMRSWMFLGQFTEVRRRILHDFDLRSIGDLDKGAFESMTTSQLISISMVVVRNSPPSGCVAVALQPTAPGEKYWGRDRTDLKRSAMLVHLGRYEFDAKGFAVIEGEPIVYWWTKEFLERYAGAPKLGDLAPVRQGLGTRDDVRFLRRWWEVATADVLRARFGAPLPVEIVWAPNIKGAAGRVWQEPLTDIVLWRANAIELRCWIELYRTTSPGQYIKNESFYFEGGLAFVMIGAEFSARAHRFRSVFGEKGSSVFPADVADTLCAMNTSFSREVLESINPTICFQVGDVVRLPVLPIVGAASIISTIEASFSAHESHREPSVEFQQPGPSQWTSAQAWAQLAVDRPDGAPLPAYTPVDELPDPEADVSFALGVALGRFGASSEGILDAAPPTALPAGILFVGPSDEYPDSLTHESVQPVVLAWDDFKPLTGHRPPLRDWLRKDFFAYHKGLYESRPIYFPLSSEKRSFVAWVSIHRWQPSTLTTLLVDHLTPVLRRLDAEIHEVNTARASSDKKAVIVAEKRYASAKKLRDELADFIAAVTACAERGAPPTDAGCPAREVDAPFVMDLDDGVMVNSAALWPLLAPQWNDPKKWWKQLCQAEGRKDYDWAHLAKRYFPKRVEEKCKVDPSLGVAHGRFWKYHPAKAFAWELRLQDEIRAGFTIDEEGSAAARAGYLREHAAEAEAAREKERVRRERKGAKAEEREEDEEPSDLTDDE